MLWQIYYESHPELILVECKNGKMNQNRLLRFSLKACEDSEEDTSITSFFQFIFGVSGKYINIDDFSKKIKQNRLKISLFKYVKRDLPKKFASLIIGKL